MRLGVSPTAASTPTGVFNQRFEVLFPCAGALGCTVCFAPPPFILVYLCTNVGLRGLLEVGLPAPFVPYSASLLFPPRQCESSPPWLPISAPPIGLDECFFFFISLVVGLPCCSIFCRFWLCEEAQCVYLRLHFGSLYFLSPTILLLTPFTFPWKPFFNTMLSCSTSQNKMEGFLFCFTK